MLVASIIWFFCLFFRSRDESKFTGYQIAFQAFDWDSSIVALAINFIAISREVYGKGKTAINEGFLDKFPND